MGKVKMSFRERNRARLARERKGINAVRADAGVDCYETGGHSKVLDFFIGVGIFFLASIFSIIGLLIVGVLTFIYYDKYFEGRRFVKYGMISYFVFAVLVFLVFLGVGMLAYMF